MWTAGILEIQYAEAVFLSMKFTDNYSIDATAYPGGRFSSGAGPIFIDNSACSGNENRLFDCPYDMHTADCTHAEDAGLRCSGRCEFLVFLQIYSCIVQLYIIHSVICVYCSFIQ